VSAEVTSLRAAVIIASAGRPTILGDVLRDVAQQTRRPDWVVLSVRGDGDLPVDGVPAGTIVVHSSGISAQRNAGIAAVPEADVVVFFDDDARVRADYLEQALAVFAADSSILGLTGRVLLDGAARAEIDTETALRALRESESVPVDARVTDRKTLYGCNLAIRTGATTQRFDERLPLYSWLEDHDLARRLLREGRLVTAPGCTIVHRGVKSGGRQAHAKLGYSQVMNPAHFVKKGSFPLWLAANEIGRRVAKNLVLSLGGPEASWRRERLRGNRLAAVDVLRGRFTPERILDL
jgi:GT2 family glycosyltransferase